MTAERGSLGRAWETPVATVASKTKSVIFKPELGRDLFIMR
jgi:hypothetical protein